MSLIPRSFINELLARSDLVELIDSRVPLRKKGHNYTACCPFHNEKTPSFTVAPAKQFYHCFGCGANGNAISFLMEFDRLSFVEAIEQLAGQLGLEVPKEARTTPAAVAPSTDLYQLMERAAGYYQSQLRHHPFAIDYLKQRGLTGHIAKDFGIGYAPDGWDNLLKNLGQTTEMIESLMTAGLLIKKAEGGYYDRFRDRIIFPIRDRRGRVIGFGGRIIEKGEPKYLNSPETPIFHKGSELYGLYEALQADRHLTRLLVVEGYMDVVALAQFGLHHVVATLGTATTAEHIQRLFRVTQEVIFSFDGDRAGQAAAWKALEVLLPLLQDGWQVKFLLLPAGDDPDSVIRKEGLEKFKQRLNEASSLADFFFTTLIQSVNLNTAEGKAALAKKGVALINKMSTNVLQQLMFERLAKMVRIDVNTLRGITHNAKSKQVVEAPTKYPVVLPRRSPMRSAIALLLQYPEIVQQLPDGFYLPEMDANGSYLIRELIQVIHENQVITTGALLEYFRERSEKELLAKLAVYEMPIPVEGALQEFLDTLRHIQKLHVDNEVEILLQKDHLTDQERERLRELLIPSK